MNYQLTDVMVEYRPEHERMLWGLGLAGNAFKKVYYDPYLERQVSLFVPAEDVVVPYGASNIQTSERVTHVMRKTENELRRLQVAGFYRDVELGDPVDSLLFDGQAFWQVVETYQEDGRPSRFEWIANSRVTATLDRDNVFVKSYAIDGTTVPMDGLGSLITFQSLSDGILNTGTSTIRAALDVQKASVIAAATPMASGYLKNTGADLPPVEVQGLLAAWKSARQNRSTAYLTSTLNYETVGFSPKDMMYNEAIQNLATEIARLCNVPPYYVSADQNTTMTYANVQDERLQFLTLSLQPFVSAIEDRLSMDDITARGNIVKFDLDSNYLRTDPLKELSIIRELLDLQLITQEQAMEMTDLTPIGSEGMQ